MARKGDGALARSGGTQRTYSCLGLPSRLMVVTLSREDPGLDPSLAFGPSLNLVGSRLQILCHPERQCSSRAIKAWTLAHNDLNLNPTLLLIGCVALGELLNLSVHLFPDV